jgi:hypothetical protein
MEKLNNDLIEGIEKQLVRKIPVWKKATVS